MIAGLLLMSCEPEQVVIIPVSTETPEEEKKPEEKKDSTVTPKPKEEDPVVIPTEMTSLPSVYIETPNHTGVNSNIAWVELATITIKGDGNKTLFQEDSLKIRGRGNSNWWYDKKPYYIKLDHKTNLIGTGKSKKWVLLANWMDRTLLRNQVAFEAARRTSMEWTPSGRFVELYLDNKFLGVYWLGEKINVEASRFKADFLYSFDTSNSNEVDFISSGTYRAGIGQWGAPVELKYPDRDKYEDKAYSIILDNAKTTLKKMTDGIAKSDLSTIDIDSFCDWFLVHELCVNYEPNHPKSCFIYWRSGKMYAGPVWDFDWYTFEPDTDWFAVNNSLWYGKLLKNNTFKKRLKARWAELKPAFETLPDYIDQQADLIRAAEEVNHAMWPCYPNPSSEDGSGMVNYDEQMTFQEAVDRMKLALTQRISFLDKAIPIL